MKPLNKYKRAVKFFNNELDPDLTQAGNPIPKELPNVSASDNGKVLTVDEGAWAAKTPSGSSVFELVEILSVDDQGIVECEKTMTEMLDMVSDGILPILHEKKEYGDDFLIDLYFYPDVIISDSGSKGISWSVNSIDVGQIAVAPNSEGFLQQNQYGIMSKCECIEDQTFTELSEVQSAFNELITYMKDSGLMKESSFD